MIDYRQSGFVEMITMDSNKSKLIPGKHFPANMKAPEQIEILSELSKYGYTGLYDICLIDTSRSSDDIRLNYAIDKKWMLRFCNAPEMTETRLAKLNRLIERYLQFGLKCPRFLPDQNGRFFHDWNGLFCYDYRIACSAGLSKTGHREQTPSAGQRTHPHYVVFRGAAGCGTVL